MRHTEYVNALRRDGPTLGRAARDAGLDAAVPGCPGWSVATLLAHQGHIHRWVTALLERAPRSEPEFWSEIEEPEPGPPLFAWYDAGVEPLVGALAAAGPDAEVWSWTDDHTAGFWARRQANETAVHRWDAESAGGSPTPVEHALAVDGIGEAFAMLPYRRGTADLAGGGETIHLHCTDGDGEWLVRLDPAGVVVTGEHAKGDVAARGTASDLLLLLYGRLSPDAVEVFGDVALLAHWQEEAKF